MNIPPSLRPVEMGSFGVSASPEGIKSRTVAGAVVLVAKGIRKGNKHFGGFGGRGKNSVIELWLNRL
jgi:hypothetical protein